jgi:hypothetical protein
MWVPTGFQVNALLRASFNNSTANTTVGWSSPDEADYTFQDMGVNYAASIPVFGRLNIRTSTGGIICCRAGTSGATISVQTYGWIDHRGRFD